jgi:hypothetical protein
MMSSLMAALSLLPRVQDIRPSEPAEARKSKIMIDVFTARSSISIRIKGLRKCFLTQNILKLIVVSPTLNPQAGGSCVSCCRRFYRDIIVFNVTDTRLYIRVNNVRSNSEIPHHRYVPYSQT